MGELVFASWFYGDYMKYEHKTYKKNLFQVMHHN